MMAGADEPATLSGLCQPMAMAMVSVLKTSIQGCSRGCEVVAVGSVPVTDGDGGEA
jgi:hypothetical protein